MKGLPLLSLLPAKRRAGRSSLHERVRPAPVPPAGDERESRGTSPSGAVRVGRPPGEGRESRGQSPLAPAAEANKMRGREKEPFRTVFYRILDVLNRCKQLFRLVCLFPLHSKVFTAHVSICCKRLVNRTTQVKRLDNRRRTQIEYLLNRSR